MSGQMQTLSGQQQTLWPDSSSLLAQTLWPAGLGLRPLTPPSATGRPLSPDPPKGRHFRQLRPFLAPFTVLCIGDGRHRVVTIKALVSVSRIKHTHTHARARARAHTPTHARTHTHARTRAHTQTHPHTYTHVDSTLQYTHTHTHIVQGRGRLYPGRVSPSTAESGSRSGADRLIGNDTPCGESPSVASQTSQPASQTNQPARVVLSARLYRPTQPHVSSRRFRILFPLGQSKRGA